MRVEISSIVWSNTLAKIADLEERLARLEADQGTGQVSRPPVVLSPAAAPDAPQPVQARKGRRS